MNALERQRPANILLVGLMGSGKSSVGRELARTLGGRFCLVDMDEIIAERAGRRIPEIFETEGEEGFRARETAVLRELLAVEGGGQVISTGGGVVVKEENRALIQEAGFVVWLDADLGTLCKRVAASNDRPLLAVKDVRGRLEALRAERGSLYSAVADLRIDTGELGISDIAYGIAESAQVYFSGGGR